MHDFYRDICKSSLYHFCEFYAIRSLVRHPTSRNETIKILLEFIHSNEICEIAPKSTCKTTAEASLSYFQKLFITTRKYQYANLQKMYNFQQKN